MIREDYQLDILMQGYPGKSVCHGGLGWSTIVLLRGHGRVALMDCGTFSHRSNLINGLKRHGLSPAEVTDVVLTHSHHDHARLVGAGALGHHARAGIVRPRTRRLAIAEADPPWRDGAARHDRL